MKKNVWIDFSPAGVYREIVSCSWLTIQEEKYMSVLSDDSFVHDMPDYFMAWNGNNTYRLSDETYVGLAIEGTSCEVCKLRGVTPVGTHAHILHDSCGDGSAIVSLPIESRALLAHAVNKMPHMYDLHGISQICLAGEHELPAVRTIFEDNAQRLEHDEVTEREKRFLDDRVWQSYFDRNTICWGS